MPGLSAAPTAMKKDRRLTIQGLNRLLRFKGYGNPSGPYWFIGIEEAGDPDPGGNLGEHVIRSRFDNIEDLAHAHSPDNLAWPLDKLIPTWATMSRIVLRLQGKRNWRDTEAVRAYQSERLGRKGGETFLTELLPLRKPSDSLWPEWRPFSKWASWDEYAKAVLPKRFAMIQRLLQRCCPRFIFWYGKWYWETYRGDLFPGAEFAPIAGGKIERAQVGESTVVLTPFFSYYSMTAGLIDRMAKELGG